MLSPEILGSSPAGHGATAQHFVSIQCDKPTTYPHTQERYEADVQRATEYVARHLAPRTTSEPRWQVTLLQSSMSRRIDYVVGGMDRVTAALRGVEIARELGDSYSFERVDALPSIVLEGARINRLRAFLRGEPTT